jgi:V-type H+-transporting ATPase subunit H
VHESDDFWKENATKLNEKDYAQLKSVPPCPISSSYRERELNIDTVFFLSLCTHRTLIKLLQESQDPVVLAVAAHDVGQYVKHHSQGKKYVAPRSIPPSFFSPSLLPLFPSPEG